MGPIDPEGSSDTKAIIVAASPSSGASSLNAAANAAGDEMAPAASTTTITITDVDGGMHVSTNNGAASTAPSAPPITATASSATVGPPAQTANVSTGPTSGYSSVYLNNRNYNILLGGKTSRIGSRYLTQGSESEMSTQIYIYYNNKNEKDIDSREGNKKKRKENGKRERDKIREVTPKNLIIRIEMQQGRRKRSEWVSGWLYPSPSSLKRSAVREMTIKGKDA